MQPLEGGLFAATGRISGFVHWRVPTAASVAGTLGQRPDPITGSRDLRAGPRLDRRLTRKIEIYGVEYDWEDDCRDRCRRRPQLHKLASIAMTMVMIEHERCERWVSGSQTLVCRPDGKHVLVTVRGTKCTRMSQKRCSALYTLSLQANAAKRGIL